MADPELEAIRQRRMQELMAQRGMGSQQNSEQENTQEEAKREAEEQRQMMLSQILASEARARASASVVSQKFQSPEDNSQCSASEGSKEANSHVGDYNLRPRTRKQKSKRNTPERARGVEDVILRAARMGQITEKVSEEKLISLLEQINTQTTKETRVTIQRRPSVLDDD